MPLTIAGVGAPMLGGLLGNIFGQGDKQKALDLQKQMLENIQKVNTPEAQQMALSLQKYQNAGQLAPQMEQTIAQSPSLLKDVQVDPRLRNAQMDSLNTLSKISAGGLRPEDMAALNTIKQQNEEQYRGNQQSILQNMAQRGILGGGGELAAQLQNAQSSANRAQSAGLDIGAQASQRALQALQARASLGSQMEGQQYGEASQAAQAQDAINRYNAMNSQQIMGTNVGTANAAQQYNLAQAQQIANQNTGIANQQAMYQAQLPMQIYQAQLQKAQAQNGPMQNMANQYMGNAAQTQQTFAGIGQGVGQGLNAYNANQQQQAYNKDYLGTLKDIYGKNNGQQDGGLPGSNQRDYDLLPDAK